MGFNQVNSHTVPIQAEMLSSIDGSADSIDVECILWGSLSKPLVVLMGGISATRWALNCPNHKAPGWWSEVINQHACLNTQDYCFLTFEYFSFPGQVINPPLVSTTDQAIILRQIQINLNLPQFHAVIGSSYGGMASLAFAAKYPTALQRLICIAAADYNSVKSQALRGIQRQIIKLGIQSGLDNKQYTSLARSLAMIGYRSEVELEERFQSHHPGQSLQDVSAYLQHHGDVFAEQFSSTRYLQLSKSIDYHQIDVSTIQAQTLLIGISSDQMVPVRFMQKLNHNLNLNSKAESQIKIIDSNYGHDGFLLEAKQIDAIFQTFFSENNHDNFKRNCRSASGY